MQGSSDDKGQDGQFKQHNLAVNELYFYKFMNLFEGINNNNLFDEGFLKCCEHLTVIIHRNKFFEFWL